MRCFCGGTLQLKSGVSQYGKQYAFWGCDRFPECNTSLKVDEYQKLEKNGVVELDEDARKPQKSWIKQNHHPYIPKQRSNNTAAVIQYRRLTDEQEALINSVVETDDVCMVSGNADAGVGKTTLLKQLAARTRRANGEQTTGIVLAFGKRPATEIGAELPFNWVASTVHSAGNAACCAKYGLNPMTPNKYKTKDILRSEFGKASPEDQPIYTAVVHLVDMCKAMAFNETVDDATLLHWAAHYNRDTSSDPSRACHMVRTILKIARDPNRLAQFGHDYGDMVWLPLVNNLPVAQYRIVAVDEAQDSSRARMLLALKICLETLIIVGDSGQAIFGFTCADTDSMRSFAALMEERAQVQHFPITVNWRCPEKIIQLTQIIHPSIKARPNAPEGHIHEITEDKYWQVARAGDVVLCRVNADLIGSAYKFIKQGKGAVVLGRDIGIQLKSLIIKLATNSDGSLCSVPELIRRAGAWYNAELGVLQAKNVRNPDEEEEKLYDNYECIVALCGAEVINGVLKGTGFATVQAVKDNIDILFGEEDDRGFDPKRVIIHSTVHKYKGGQGPRIFMLRPSELHPHPAAKSAWELDQEKNILYVAITRCGDGTDNPDQRLFFVGHKPTQLSDGASLITPYEEIQ